MFIDKHAGAERFKGEQHVPKFQAQLRHNRRYLFQFNTKSKRIES